MTGSRHIILVEPSTPSQVSLQERQRRFDSDEGKQQCCRAGRRDGDEATVSGMQAATRS